LKWDLKGEKYPGKRLHVRAVIRDGERAFVGSQSLRNLELDERREVGIIIDDDVVVRQMIAMLERDWAETDSARKEAKKAQQAERPTSLRASGRLVNRFPQKSRKSRP
jgi:phosphatidylserine/phosphatidylglycerophosphate/cardiolipin synthase-like enzyme